MKQTQKNKSFKKARCCCNYTVFICSKSSCLQEKVLLCEDKFLEQLKVISSFSKGRFT